MPPSYFEHVSGQGKRKETSFDALEFDPQPAGIEVEERQFERVYGQAP